MAEINNNLNHAISSNIELLNSLGRNDNPITNFINNIRKLYKKISISIARMITSKISLVIFYFLYRQYKVLTRITFFGNIASVIFNFIHFCRNYYPEFIIAFGLIYPSFALLVILFERSFMQFLVFLLPILIFITFCMLTVFYFIDRKDSGEKISVIETLGICLKKFFSIIVVFYLNISLFFEFIILFIYSALLLSLFFNANWEYSFLFWTLTSFVAIVIFYLIFTTNIVFTQALFNVVMGTTTPFQAVISGIYLVKKNLLSFLFLHFLLLFTFSFFIFSASVNYFENGFIIALVLYYLAAIFLNYLFRRTLVEKDDNNRTHLLKISGSFKISYIFLCMLGIPSIMSLNYFSFSIYPQITTYIAQQEDNILAMREMINYQDAKQGFAIAYPKTWTMYNWNDSSVTFYTNDTGSPGDGIWVSVTVNSLYSSRFTDLYYSNPGIVPNAPGETNMTTKVSNMLINGYETVKYIYVKQGDNYTEYQTHYLVHKVDKTYDIVFTTNSQEAANQNSQIFERILNSFSFTN